VFTGQNKNYFIVEVRKMKKLVVLMMVVAVAGLANAFLMPNALDPSSIVASPGKSIPGDDGSPTVLDRQGNFQGEWAFGLWALYAVNGAGLNAAGEHQTGDTGAMYMDDSGFCDMPTGLNAFDNNTYRGYVNAMFDASYEIDKLHVWNFNGEGGARGFNDVDIWVSNDFGASYNLLISGNFMQATGAGDLGVTYDIPDVFATDIIIAAKTNHGDGSWYGLSEVQFIQTPEPMTMALLGLGGLFIRRKR
jgi:hypothetical protein